VLPHRNTDCDYSAAYITLFTDSDLVGHGLTFTIGRGTDIVSPYTITALHPLTFDQVVEAVKAIADRLIGKSTDTLFADMGKAWEHLTADSQLRWCACTPAPTLC
jgi:L-fuconate dehydratase